MQNTAGKLWLILFVAILLQSALWIGVRSQQTKWLGLPPLPSPMGQSVLTLGDPQFSYRAISTMLQNAGDGGGRITNLAAYDYERLAKWFAFATSLDQKSNFIPYIAAYYYGAPNAPEQYLPIIAYLRKVGSSRQGEKWRWLMQAVHLARYRAKDLNLAYEIALELAELGQQEGAKMPAWTRQMPAFVLNAQGEKEAALAMMLGILKSSAEELHPNEVMQMRYYICTELLRDDEAKANPLCKNIP